MNKQKVCIVGGGLAGLLTSIALSKCGIDIDLISKDFKKKQYFSTTTAVSHTSFNFLKNAISLEKFSKNIWPVNEMEIYTNNKNGKNKKILNFSSENNGKKVMYILDNRFFSITMKNKIKSLKNIFLKSSFKKKESYNLIINCTGANSAFTKSIKENKFIKHNYKQTSFSLKIKHDQIENKIARQFFLKEGPLALLPLSSTETSIVWSIKDFYLPLHLKEKKNYIYTKIKIILKDYFKLRKFSSIEIFNLNFQTSKNYYSSRILNFGDALHKIHPLAGQGFNMCIRDIIVLKKIINEKNKLGLDIGDGSALIEFSNKMKSKNFIYSSGIEIINGLFSIKKTPIITVRDIAVQNINKSKLLKKFFLNFADKGLIS